MVLFRGYGRGGIDKLKQLLVTESMHLFIPGLFLNVAKRYSCKMGGSVCTERYKMHYSRSLLLLNDSSITNLCQFFEGVGKIFMCNQMVSSEIRSNFTPEPLGEGNY